ncbi:MAG: acyltransferase family protein [Rhodothermales bacterium]
MHHRDEIDGLRAFAVMPVVFFHLGIPPFTGGFIGVDIFFVISGYLITSIVLKEIEAGKFSIVNFYERRIRRIFPALFAVILVCIPISMFIMIPTEFESFSKSIISTITFTSNILFWQEVGYFETVAEEKPLLHTWSLAVEEQFYLIFPLIMLAILTLSGKKTLLFILILSTLASLILSSFASVNYPIPNFYLIPTRAWELSAGCFCALANITTKKGIAEILAAFGLATVLISIFLFDSLTPFPSHLTVLPVVGTCLIILFARKTIVETILSLRVFVWIGLLSYSIYLWHQPLSAFSKLAGIFSTTPIFLTSYFALLFCLSILSYKFVEIPFRRMTFINRKRVFLLSAGAATILLFAGVFGITSNGAKFRFSDQQLTLIEPSSSEYACEAYVSDEIEYAKSCLIGDANSDFKIALIGDSHADALASELFKEFDEKSIAVERIFSDYCHPIPNLYDTRYTNVDRCEKYESQLRQHIEKEVDAVLIHLRWTFRLYPIPNQIQNLNFDNGEGGIEHDNMPRENFALIEGQRRLDGASKLLRMNEFIQNLAALEKPVIIVGPVPEPGWHVPKYNMQRILFGQTSNDLSTSYERYKTRNSFVLSFLQAIKEEKNVSVVYPHDTLCSDYVRCNVQVAGNPLYFDDDHLSAIGVRTIKNSIIEEISKFVE